MKEGVGFPPGQALKNEGSGARPFFRTSCLVATSRRQGKSERKGNGVKGKEL